MERRNRIAAYIQSIIDRVPTLRFSVILEFRDHNGIALVKTATVLSYLATPTEDLPNMVLPVDAP
jgi:hypothetical protein